MNPAETPYLPEAASRAEGELNLPMLVWRFAEPRRVAATSVLGGGVGDRSWVLNATVQTGYARLDPADHLHDLAEAVGLHGAGVGLMTAVDMRLAATSEDHGVVATATVGFGAPTWAAAPDDDRRDLHDELHQVGTINVVAFLPVALDDGALVNAVATITEAKAQALWDLDVAATGTATDAVCVSASRDGSPEVYGGPRSTWGSRLARATHAAVLAGGRSWLSSVLT